MDYNLDTIIIVLFFIITFYIGIRYANKIKTIKEYAVGNRNFSTGTIVAAIVATWISGSMFLINLSMTYSNGLYHVISVSGMSLSFLITAYVFLPKMNFF